MEYQDPTTKKGFPAWAWALIGCGGCGLLIIPIMAAILFPVFAKAREAARMASCQTNLKEICMAMQMYENDYGVLPSAGPGVSDLDFETKVAKPAGTTRQNWPFSVVAYLPKSGSFPFFCPSDSSYKGRETSYAYKHAVHLAAKAKIPTKAFNYPAQQIILYERASFHWGGMPIADGLSINVGFVDGHVKTVRMQDVGPESEPWYFNTVDPTRQNMKKPYWDPRYCYDRFP